jgi:hypothetical protein
MENTYEDQECYSWPDSDTQALYDSLIKRYKFHKDYLEKSARKAANIGLKLRLAIPITSALVTFVSGIIGALPNAIPLYISYFSFSIVPSLGFFLTILTIVNSTKRPGEVYTCTNEALILLREWKFDLDATVKELDKPEKAKLCKLLREKDKKLSDVGRKFVNLDTSKTRNRH